MKDEAKKLYREMFDAYSALNPLIESAQQAAQGEISLEELADYSLAVKRATELASDLKKKLSFLLEGQKRILCMRWMTAKSAGVSIKTGHVCATPRVTIMPTLPNKRKAPEEYIAFLRFYGLSDSIIENDSFRPHWPGMKQQIADDAENGRPLPPGCDPARNYSVYDVTLRSRKGVLED